jgi:hypothetical protein
MLLLKKLKNQEVQRVADAPIIADHPSWLLHFKAAGAGSHSSRISER